MVRSFTVAFMVVSAGGICLDKPSPECATNVHEEACTNADICAWIGGMCLDKPTLKCGFFDGNQQACEDRANSDLCVWWVGGKLCLDKPSSYCVPPATPIPEACGVANTLCVWVGSSVAGDDQVQEGEGEDEGGDDQEGEDEGGDDQEGEGEDEGGDDCVDVDGYGDHLGNVCAHYANNIQNCKHSDASKPGTDGKTPCEACCACGGCPAPTCAAHTCPEGRDALPLSSEISCGNYGDACTDDDCCKVATITCGGDYTCPEGRQAKATDTVCAEGTCTDDSCCDVPVTCDADYPCAHGWHHKADGTVCPTGDCTATLCCEQIPITCETCDTVSCHGQHHNQGPLQCTSGTVKKPNAADITCDWDPDPEESGYKCTEYECCQEEEDDDNDSSSDGAYVTALSASAAATISAAMAIFN